MSAMVKTTVRHEALSPLENAIGHACTEIARAFAHADERQRKHMQRAIAELSAALRESEER